jgi:hypothetical protein
MLHLDKAQVEAFLDIALSTIINEDIRLGVEAPVVNCAGDGAVQFRDPDIETTTMKQGYHILDWIGRALRANGAEEWHMAEIAERAALRDRPNFARRLYLLDWRWNGLPKYGS